MASPGSRGTPPNTYGAVLWTRHGVQAPRSYGGGSGQPRVPERISPPAMYPAPRRVIDAGTDRGRRRAAGPAGNATRRSGHAMRSARRPRRRREEHQPAVSRGGAAPRVPSSVPAGTLPWSIARPLLLDPLLLLPTRGTTPMPGSARAPAKARAPAENDRPARSHTEHSPHLPRPIGRAGPQYSVPRYKSAAAAAAAAPCHRYARRSGGGRGNSKGMVSFASGDASAQAAR